MDPSDRAVMSMQETKYSIFELIAAQAQDKAVEERTQAKTRDFIEHCKIPVMCVPARNVSEHIPCWNTYSGNVAVFFEVFCLPIYSLLYCFVLSLCHFKFKGSILHFPHAHHCPARCVHIQHPSVLVCNCVYICVQQFVEFSC